LEILKIRGGFQRQALPQDAVLSGWVISRSFAAAPTSTEPSSSTLTTLFVLYSPSSLGISSALPF
jgi:hypothetical protein